MLSRSVIYNSFATPWTAAFQAPPPWDFSSKNTGMGFHFLLQEIFPTQGLNSRLLCLLRLLHCRWFLYPLKHWGNPHTLPQKNRKKQRVLISKWIFNIINATNILFFVFYTSVNPPMITNFMCYLYIVLVF